MKKLLIILLLLSFLLPLYSVTFSSTLLSVSSSSSLYTEEGRKDGFFSGFFPLEAKYGYRTDVVEELGLSVDFDFSSGMKERALLVNPENGKKLDNIPYYQVQYIYFALSLKAALIQESFMDEDILSLSLSI